MASPSAPTPDLVQQFTARAEAVGTVVRPITSLEQAAGYAVSLCAGRPACDLLVSGQETAAAGSCLCREKTGRILAACGLAPPMLAALEQGCADAGIQLVTADLRRFAGGLDMAVTVADAAVADTGTLVMDATDEDLRLATMICEVHVAVVRASTMVATAADLAPAMEDGQRRGPSYWTFVTGASRTADIERVLALGVHGPVDLHVLLVEDGPHDR